MSVLFNSHRITHIVVTTSFMWARSYHDLDVKMNPFNTKSHLLTWTPLGKGRIKLNSNGAVSSDGSSIGGVIRDANANWLWGYSLSFGTESFFKVEVRALLKGLNIAWNKGFRKVVVEYDNALLVDLIISDGGANSSLVEVCLLH